jgi:hypothetical protein
VAGRVDVEQAEHVLDVPAQAAVRAVDQRRQPGLRTLATRALAVADVKLAEPAQLPPHVIQVEHPRLVDPQADICGQASDGVVARGRGELAAGGQLPAPPGEQLLHLLDGRRDAQLCVDRGSRPVDLIERALHHTAGEVVQLDLVPQLQEPEVHRQRRHPARAGRRPRVAQHLAEVGVRVRRLHLPQRTAEPIADQLEVIGVVADRAVCQPGRGPRQNEPHQHVGLEVREFLGRRRCPRRSRTTARANPRLLDFTRNEEPSAGQ